MSAARTPVRLAADHLHGFVSALVDAGVTSGADARLDFLRAVALSPPRAPAELYWRARITLVRRLEDVQAFDAVFAAWFGDGLVSLVPPLARRRSPGRGQQLRRGLGAGEESAARRRGAGSEASLEDVIGRRGFPETTPRQLRLLAELEAMLAEELPATRARRRRAARHGDRLDLGRVLRGAQRHGGEVVRLRWRNRPRRPRRVLLLVDVSGSLRRTSGESLRFAYALVGAAPRSEVFTFGTRLTRVTRQLRRRDVDAALARVAEIVPDVDGGTRIGAALAEFLADGRRAALARDALVLVVSDGLERGDVREMANAVARISRLASRVVWWNPLACDPGYRPVARGMAAVLADLDDLAGVAGLDSALDEVCRLGTVSTGPRRAARHGWEEAVNA